MPPLNPMFQRRPLAVTIVSIFVLCITAWNVLRAWAAINAWETLGRFHGNPVYILVSGLVWLICGVVLFIGLAQGRRFAWHATLISSVLYIVWYWLDRLIIQPSPAGNLAFSAVASLLIYAIFNALLFWPSSRAFFTRRSHE